MLSTWSETKLFPIASVLFVGGLGGLGQHAHDAPATVLIGKALGVLKRCVGVVERVGAIRKFRELLLLLKDEASLTPAWGRCIGYLMGEIRPGLCPTIRSLR